MLLVVDIDMKINNAERKSFIERRIKSLLKDEKIGKRVGFYY